MHKAKYCMWKQLGLLLPQWCHLATDIKGGHSPVMIKFPDFSRHKQEIWAKLTRRAKAYSISSSVVIVENWGVHAKLIYKYQILYLDHKR